MTLTAAALDLKALDHALNLLPLRFRGPGGVAGVVKEGQVIARRVWGYRDSAARKPMTADTRLPICSITKQFTCALLLDQFTDHMSLDAQVVDFLPDYRDPLPTVAELAHNQSGLRDYWALTVLHGATPEAEFPRDAALPLMARMKTGHFAPGTAYSYSNGNYRILAGLIERATGRALADLYAERLFAPAGMTTALLAPDTRTPPDGVVGYEGNDETGFLPAQNGIWWEGDAGIAASLEDMLAWEAFIDATRDDPQGLYNRLAAPVTFRDGTPAPYAWGLRQDRVAGHAVTGHGGALRGFRCNRMHAAGAQLSVVVMFNHEANAHAAATYLMETALGAAPVPTGTPEGWNGLWLDRANGLALRTEQDATGITLRYGTTAARLTMTADGAAAAPGLHLRQSDGGLTMRREAENLTVRADRLEPLDWADGGTIAGRYWSEELGAHLTVTAQDGTAFAGFEGLLGSSPMERMYPLARDLWIITTRRSMDAAPPGDWTVQVHRDGAGAVAGLTVGCWLARNIRYAREG